MEKLVFSTEKEQKRMIFCIFVAVNDLHKQ